MKITCHSCGAKYTVSDEKVQGKTVKMKCRKCSATIVVGASQGDAAVADDGALGAADASGGSYQVNVAEGDTRTMSLAEVVDAYNSQVITQDTYVWADGMADWQPLAENDAIVAALNEAAQPSDPGHAAGANGNGGYGAPEAAAPSPGAGFASPSADYAAASPYQAAAEPAKTAKKEPAKRSQDLFGGGGGGFSDASSGMAAVGSGKKGEENSVLFSLSALTGLEQQQPKRSSTTATKEDSGLIDLKALAASAPVAPSADAIAFAPALDAGGLFPLGAPVLAPPPVAAASFAAPAAAGPQEKSKLPLILGGLVAVLCVVVVFLVVKGSGDTAPTATAAVAAAPPTAAPTPTFTPSPQTDTTADAAPETSSSAAVAAGPKGTWKKAPPGTTTKANTTSGGGPTPPATTPPAAPARGNCGCAKSDLNCAMACAAKGGK